MYYVYLAKNEQDQLYTGITENLQKRINVHNTKQGALFTRSGNFKIIFHEEYSTIDIFLYPDIMETYGPSGAF